MQNAQKWIWYRLKWILRNSLRNLTCSRYICNINVFHLQSHYLCLSILLLRNHLLMYSKATETDITSWELILGLLLILSCLASSHDIGCCQERPLLWLLITSHISESIVLLWYKTATLMLPSKFMREKTIGCFISSVDLPALDLPWHQLNHVHSAKPILLS